MTLAFEFKCKKLFFFVSLILVFSVASISAQTDICNIKTDFLNLTDKNVMLESFQIIEVDFDHTFNTVYFTPKKEMGLLEINFRNVSEFRMVDFKVDRGSKTVFFDPNVRVVNNSQEYSFRHELKFEGMETLKVTYWSNNVIQNRPAWMYPLDSYSLFLNNVDVAQGFSVGKKFCFPNIPLNKGPIFSKVEVAFKCGNQPVVIADIKPNVQRPSSNIAIIGPITHTIEGNIKILI